MNKPEGPPKLKRYLCAFLVVFLLVDAVAADPPDPTKIKDAKDKISEAVALSAELIQLKHDTLSKNIDDAKGKVETELKAYEDATQNADATQLDMALTTLAQAVDSAKSTPEVEIARAGKWLQDNQKSCAQFPVYADLKSAYDVVDGAQKQKQTPTVDQLTALADAKQAADQFIADPVLKPLIDQINQAADGDTKTYAVDALTRYVAKRDSYNEQKLKKAVCRLRLGAFCGKTDLILRQNYGYSIIGGLVAIGAGGFGGWHLHRLSAKPEPVNPTPTQNTSEETSPNSDAGKFWLYLFVTVALVAIVAGAVWFFYYREQTNSGSSKASDGGEKGDKSEGSKKASSATGASSTGATGSNTSTTEAGSSSAKVSGTASSGKPSSGKPQGSGQATKTSS